MKTSKKVRQGLLRVDMHVHTRGSDGSGIPEDIYKHMMHAGLDGIVVTDHHHTHTKEGDRVVEYINAQGKKDGSGRFALHGCEYSTADGHVLIYGVDVDTLGLGQYPTMEFVLKAVQAAGGIAVPSHPFHGYRQVLSDKVFGLRGLRNIEALNGQCEVRYPIRNRKAEEAARLMGMSGIGGSDAHSVDYIGVCYTEFNQGVRKYGIVSAIRRGLCRPFMAQDRVHYLGEKWYSSVDQLRSQFQGALGHSDD